MMNNLPKVKGLPDGLDQKLAERKADYEKMSLEWKKTRLEYLKEKIKADVLLDISMSSNKSLSPDLIVNKSKWVQKVQAAILNKSSKNVKLPPELAESLTECAKGNLLEQCAKLLSHWNLPDSSEKNDCIKAKQLTMLIQTDLETIKSNMDQNAFTVKQLKQESRRKELLQNHVKMARELVCNHALGHVASLNRLHVDYTSAKKKNLELKTRCKELEIMLMTYTPEANRALSKIRKLFLEEIEAAEKKEAGCIGELQQFQSLGLEFESLAEKYGKILQEIQSSQWMLSSIKESE